MARIIAVVAVLAAAACSAEIGTGTYFCGPEQFCPPDLECNPNTFSCETPGTFEAFSCPFGASVNEPDEAMADAYELTLECGANTEDFTLCIDDGQDVDHFSFEMEECFGESPHLSFEIRYPVALAELQLELLDDAGQVLEVAETCTAEQNFTGMEWKCIDIPPLEPGVYFLRVSTTGERTCSGDCEHNQYRLAYRYPLA